MAAAVVRKVLGRLVEWVCLALMVLLCVDIFLGVFSRYVLLRTFTWYDEIALACFVWMVFLGAAVGVRQHAHFRLHVIVARLAERTQRAIDLIGLLVVVGVGAVLIQQGWALVELGRFQRTPVMGLSKLWVYLAIPVGGGLMILFSLFPLWQALRGALWGSSLERAGAGARGGG